MPAPSKSIGLEKVLSFPLRLSEKDLLANREDGERERVCLEEEIEAIEPGGVVGVDVGQVRFINYSFSDECFGKVCGRLQSGEYPDRFVVLIAPREELETSLHDIYIALKNRKLAMLWITHQDALEYGVVGELSEALKETLRAVEPGDTNEILAAKLNIKPTACINRTDKLTRMRLLRKKLHAGEYGYKQYEFAPVLPPSE